MPTTTFCLEDHSADAGVTWVGHPDGTAVAGAAGHPFAGATSADPGASWRSSDLTVANTRTLWQAPTGKPSLVGGVSAAGHNLSHLATYQVLADPYWTIRRTVELDAAASRTASFGSLATSADTTILCRCRLHPFDNPDAVADSDAIFWLGTGFTNALSDYRLSFDASGYLKVWVSRYAGSPVTIADTVRRDDGATWLDIVLRIDDATGCELLINEVSIGTATPPAHSSQTSQTLNLSRTETRVDVAEIQIWSRDLNTAARRAMAWDAVGDESGLVLLSRMTGTGSTLTALAGTNGATAGSPDRGVIYNPSPAADSGVLEAHGPWRARRSLRLGGGTATQDWTRDTPRGLALELWFRLDAGEMGTPAAFLGVFGNTSGTDVRLRKAAGTGASIAVEVRGVDHVTTGLADGAWHHLFLTVGGSADTADLYIDGVLENSYSGLTAYSATGTFRARLESTAGSPWEVSDVRLWDAPRALPAAPLVPPAPWSDPRLVLHWPLDSETIDNAVDGTAATEAALTKTWVNRVRDDAAASSVYFRPGADARVEGYAERAASAPDTISATWAAVEAAEVALVLWDPENADSYVEIGHLGVWSTFEPALSRTVGASTRPRAPAAELSPSSLAYAVLGPSYDVEAISLSQLQPEEARELHQRLARALGTSSPVLLTLDVHDRGQGLAAWENVYGYLVDLPAIEEWASTGLRRATFSVRRAEETSWR